jgi:hypothetical protein
MKLQTFEPGEVPMEIIFGSNLVNSQLRFHFQSPKKNPYQMHTVLHIASFSFSESENSYQILKVLVTKFCQKRVVWMK